MEEEKIGTVIRFFRKPMVAAVAIEEGSLTVGDALHIRGRVTDLYHRVDSIEIDHRAARSVRAGDLAGIRLPERVREQDLVFIVKEGEEDG
jgi:translation elongation factor EF-Tu-like GTPase